MSAEAIARIEDKLDALLEVVGVETEDEGTPEGWYFETADGYFNITALLNERQLAKAEEGINPQVSPLVLTIFHRSASAVVAGEMDTTDARLLQFIEDNEEIYGEYE